MRRGLRRPSLYTLKEMLAWRRVPAWQRLVWLDEMNALREAGLRGRRLARYRSLQAKGW